MPKNPKTPTLVLDPPSASLLTGLPSGVKIKLEFVKLPSGEIVVTTDAPKKTKQQLLEEKYSRLKGHGITISQAAIKYEVSREAIENWVYQAKYVRFVDEVSYPKKIDEAEVALCADIYRKRREQKGRLNIPFFDEDGYIVEGLKHPGRSHRQKK